MLARGGRYWVYAFLLAKSDRANIKASELADFRRLADAYAAMTEAQVAKLLTGRELVEICHAEDDDDDQDEGRNEDPGEAADIPK